jgi:actin-related protein 8
MPRNFSQTTAMNHSTYHLRPVPLQPQQQQQQQQQPTAPPDPPLSDVNMLPPPPESSAASSSAASPAPESSAISTASATPQPQQPPSIDASSSSTPQPPPPPHQLTSTPAPIPAPAPAPISFDIVAEAAKVPLEVAICNSLLSLPSEGKVKAMTNSLLLVGGTASLPALGYALQSRFVIRPPPLPGLLALPSPSLPSYRTWFADSNHSLYRRLVRAFPGCITDFSRS